MANSTSIEILRRGIAASLGANFPTTHIYDSPTQQNVKLPCFFLTVEPSTFTQGIGWNERELLWSLDYLEEFNLPDTQTRLTATLETLDLTLQYITVTDPTDHITRVVHTYKRAGKLDLVQSMLHYTLQTKEWVTLPATAAPTMPSNVTITLETK